VPPSPQDGNTFSIREVPVQRRARTTLTSAALAVAVAAGAAACTGGSGPGDEGATEPGATSSSAAAPRPGKYRTLPEPCGAVSRDMLEALLPGAAEGSRDGGDADAVDAMSATPSPYEGEPSVTYDTDRRSGCSWENATTLGSRRLSVDFERVVSYDPEVSDDEQAELLYEQRVGEARLSASRAPAEPSAGEDGRTADAKPTPNGGSGEEADGDEKEPVPVPSASASEEPPSPRTLDGIGDAAYLNDELVGTDRGRASQRNVTLVFRAANVLVTVEYSQSLTDEYRTPDRGELNGKAQDLARRLAEQFDD
jgi:hypothetical protein